MINKVEDVDFVCGYELPKEFVIVARGLFGGTVTVNSCYAQGEMLASDYSLIRLVGIGVSWVWCLGVELFCSTKNW